ncbi:MAG: DnaD domain protein [Lachnospiraceae bacterium]|nr:DnaD domain protein [Lachnospiraceae bacterium]
MDGISVYSEDTRTTLVPNEFIDYYMPRANGAFVKVYLYLLRCLTAPEAGFGISAIADALEETEKDILRALRYWEKETVLSLTWGQENEIRGIKLNRLTNPALQSSPVSLSSAYADSVVPAYAAAKESPDTPVRPVSAKKEVPAILPDYTPAQLDEFSAREDTNWLLHAAESYLERMLKPADVQLLFFLHDDLCFSNELILHLYEYCVSRGKKAPSYIQKVALSWHEDGIDSVEKAEERSLQFDTCFTAVNRAFALNRAPGISERRFLNRWSTLGFSSDLIEEACSRALLSTSHPDFKYADKILERWHQNNVHTMSDVKKLDEAHNARAARGQAPTGNNSAGNRFNAFPQRNYSDNDLSDLETALLATPAAR